MPLGQHGRGTVVPPPSGTDADAEAGRSNDDAAARRLLSTIDSAKLEIPIGRAGIVRRERLLTRLRSGGDRRVISVVAAAGTGKTTLLAQLARAADTEVAWVTVDDGDNDAKQLLRCITASIARGGPVDPSLVASLWSPDSGAVRVLPRLTNALRDEGRVLTVVIDDGHLITNPHALDVLSMLVERLPAGSSVVMAGRTEPALPLPRWRAMGILSGVDTRDLALDLEEAEQVIATVGVRFRRADVEAILEATEGWAAGVYLAALSGRANGPAGVRRHLGEDAYITSYIDTELLADLPPDDLSFLTRTSILHALSGPLCDVVAGTPDSAVRLDELERRNMLVIPIDPERRWFRYHTLLRDALRRRLEQADPASVANLHLAASTWFAEQGDVPRAVEHALDAAAIDTASRLIDGAFLELYRAGGEGMLARWMHRIGDAGIASDARLPFVAAWLAVMQGAPDDAERWTAVAEERFTRSAAAIRERRGGALALLRALQCRNGLGAMRADVDLALRLEPPHGLWRAATLVMAGVARVMAGEQDEAQALFREVEGMEHAAGTAALHMALGERALHAMEQRSWAESEELVRRHRTSARSAGIEEYQTSLLGLIAEARLLIRRGDVPRARELVVRAQLVRPKLSRTMPHWAVRCLVELARTQLLLADTAGAAASVRQAEEIVRQRPGLGVLVDHLADIRGRLDVATDGAPSSGTLTPAELRLLSLLQTHLTFKEMANRLGISPNTAKTESMSLYAKLNATSRSEAVEHAIEVGLLESMLPPLAPLPLTRRRRCPDGRGQGLL